MTMSDLISRQAVIDELTKWKKAPDYSAGERNIMACTIDLLSTFPLAWIDVKDRLPDKSEEYLTVSAILDKRKIKILSFVNDLEGLDPNEFKGKSRPGFVDYDSELGLFEWPVTHWMPLPNPPKQSD